MAQLLVCPLFLVMLFSLMLGGLALVTATTDAEEPCCQGDCPVKKNQKYYSVIAMTCEEACFPFDELDAMLELNPRLVPSHTIYPCHSHGFSSYLETVTTGDDAALTMDVYTKPPKDAKEKCCQECTAEGEDKYYSIDREWASSGPWNCRESCLRPEDAKTSMMLAANTSAAKSPCLDRGFDVYLRTQITGASGLDVYTKEQ